MTDQPKFDDITLPFEIEAEIEALPEVEKEPARQSLRFAVFLFTVALVIGVNTAGHYLPVFSHIPASELQSLSWQLVAAGAVFIGARTVRNTK